VTSGLRCEPARRASSRCRNQMGGVYIGEFPIRAIHNLVPPAGIEPAHMASEANALSAELRGRWLKPTGPVCFDRWSEPTLQNF
jgi:hypothetical protein